MTKTSSAALDLSQLRETYRDKLPAEIRNIRSLWEKLLHVKWNDDAFSLFHRLVHNLAGSAGSYGFPEVSKLAASTDQLLTALEDRHNPPGEHERARISGSLQRLVAMLESSAPLEVLEAGQNLTPKESSQTQPATRVLMLEDDADHATLIQSHLEHHGCVVDIVETKQSLLNALDRATPDLLIVDIMLPGEPNGGIDAVKQAKTSGHTNLPVLFMSARGDLEARIAAVRAGGDGYFVKPVDINELVHKIDGLRDATDTSYRVLIVDDDADMATLHALLLRKAGLVTRELTQPVQILHVLQEFRPDLILMDLHMPGCPGGELTQVIRQDARFAEIPILFVSGEADPARQNAALGQGGDAFLVKPVADQQLVEAVSNRVKRARALSQRLQCLRQKDPHTGFINQNALMAKLETTIDELSGSTESAALLFIEINDFRSLRNQIKFVSTELLLTNVAATIRSEIGPTEQIARVGSASFVVLLSGISSATAMAVSDRIRKIIAGKIYFAGVQNISLTVSIGVAPLNDSYAHADDWLSGGAIACDIARTAGSDNSYLHNPKSDRQTEREQHESCARQLRAALAADALRYVYQPIASLCGDPYEKYDVLVRMDDPHGREILPARFLPVANKEKLSADIDRAVTRNSVKVLAQRHHDGHKSTFFVKLSAMTLADRGFAPWLAKLLSAEQLAASALVFEFPEKIVATRVSEASALFQQLQHLGCGIALEHFGTSLDSMQLLRHLHVDYIKVDGTFVHNLDRNRANQDTIRKLLDPNDKFDVMVIASFVEDASSLSALYQCGVQFIQGNFLQEPNELLSFSFGDTCA